MVVQAKASQLPARTPPRKARRSGLATALAAGAAGGGAAGVTGWGGLSGAGPPVMLLLASDMGIECSATKTRIARMERPRNLCSPSQGLVNRFHGLRNV